MSHPVVVTGAASGLGAAVVARLHTLGVEAIGVDLHSADIEADLGTGRGRERAIAEASRRAGGALAGLVSCAAVSPIHPDPAVVVGVNYFGALAMLDGLLPALGAVPRSAAVAIASIGAVDRSADDALVDRLLAGDEAAVRIDVDDGTDFRSAIAYSSAKRAVALGVRARAARWGEAGVRLNAIAPGRMETPMLAGLLADPVIAAGISHLPVGVRLSGSADDVAGAVMFLLGEDANFVHGQVLFVDGGTEALMRPDVI